MIKICFVWILLFAGVGAIFGQPYLEMIEEGQRVEEIQQSANAYFQNRDRGKGSGYKQWKRWEYDALRRMDDEGYLISDHFYYRELARYNQFLNQQEYQRTTPCMGDWRPLGPTEIKGWADHDQGIGRLTSIAIDHNNEKHIIVGSQTAGVWRTEDGGINWTPLSDFLLTLRVYSLAIDPTNSNIYYWGNTHGTIFKSLDRGNTWQELSFDGRGFIYNIRINPRNTQELWASDTYHGVFHSNDGGTSWEQIVTDKCYDIEFHPTDTNVIYASGHELWRSDNGGQTFENLNVGFTQNQPLMMAVSAAAPNKLYVLQCINRGFEGLYISEDIGDLFEEKDQGSTNLMGYDIQGRDGAGQAPRNMDIAVSQTDGNEIFIAGINMWRSLNGGTSFNIISHWGYSNNFPDLAYTHADIEQLAYNNDALFICSDGGLYRMDDPSSLTINKSSIEDLSKGLNIQQIYRIGIVQADTTTLSVGAQDNGCSILTENKWRRFAGGDGTETFIVNNNGNKIIFGSSQYGSLNFSVDNGQSSQPVVGLSHLTNTGKWITPFLSDPNEEKTIYAGYDRVYRSRDLGVTFEPISQDFHPSEIVVATTGSDTIYACSATNVYRTTNGGVGDWARVLFVNVNRDEVNYMAVHPTNAKLIALAVSGATKVLVSRDAGENWEQWADDLPAFQALTIAWQDNDEDALYLGMDVGIYYSDKANRAWRPFNHGLPNVKVNEIEINYVTNEIYAGTYGRGIWVSPLCEPNISSVQGMSIEDHLVVSTNPILQGEDIRIKAININEVELRLFNQNGFIAHQNLTVDLINGYQIHTPNLYPGIYYLRISNRTQAVIRKIVVN